MKTRVVAVVGFFFGRRVICLLRSGVVVGGSRVRRVLFGRFVFFCVRRFFVEDGDVRVIGRFRFAFFAWEAV